MARNCHISVYNAVILNELNPVYIYPEYDEEYGYYKGITLKKLRTLWINTAQTMTEMILKL